jgi:transposase InsO family protein
VSKSGYYQWSKHANEKPRDYGDYLLIKDIFNKGKQKYGWRQVRMHLKRQEKVIMNHKKIIRIMRKYGLVVKIRRRNPYKAIMKKTAEHRIFENKLDRQFLQTIPYKVFCTDITYMPFGGRFAYLSVAKDIASGEIMAWHLLPHLTMP